MTHFNETLALDLPPDPAYLPTAAAAATNAARVVGLSKDKALRLNLAVEEIFLTLCRTAAPASAIRLGLGSGGWFAGASFTFQAASLDPRMLNITAKVEPDDALDEDMGLLLASRTLDRFGLERRERDVFVLTAEVDKSYPEAEPAPKLSEPVPPYAYETVDGDDLRLAVLLALKAYGPCDCPDSFRTPGRLLDMAKAGYYRAVVALDARRSPAGLVVWRAASERSAAFSGPYLFCPASERAATASRLVETFLAGLGRSGLLYIVSDRVTADLPKGYFERLGTVDCHRGGACQPVTTLFRAMGEDIGATVWAHALHEPFLRAEYKRLAFFREILPAAPTGQSLPPHSLLSASVDAAKGQAVISPDLDGEDMAANIRDHVDALCAKGLPDIFAHLDLSQSWQAALAPALDEAGFKPVLVLPHASRADVLVLKHAAAV